MVKPSSLLASAKCTSQRAEVAFDRSIIGAIAAIQQPQFSDELTSVNRRKANRSRA